MKKYGYKLLYWISLLGCVIYFIGCSESEKNQSDKYLIQVGKTGMTLFDFNKAFEMEKASYPYEVIENIEFLRTARLDFLKQITEKMLLLERARELHLEVSNAELNKAISNIRADYPDDEFEQALLKSAISYNIWKKELKDRLLMEKVVAKELGKAIQLNVEDMEKYYDNTTDIPKDSAEIKAQTSQRKKTEEAYDIWIKKLQKKYVIKIDQAQWEE